MSTKSTVLPVSTEIQSSTERVTPSSGLVALILFSLCGFLALYLDAPPRPLPAQTQSEFSAENAVSHVKVMGQHPHPLGSAQHDVIRDYIVQTLTQKGIVPEIQKTTAVNAKYGMAGRVENIVARLKGEGQGKAIALVAHYDSVPTGPGASDDSAAVAALMETAGTLKTLPPLKRDAIFLFTDGEEDGLLGARAFVQEHPWAKDIGVVLNFEARGSHGATIMFETSNQNGWLIENFGLASSHPVANSLSYEIYKRLPNNTDFSIFRQAGYAGLNFAFIDGLPAYHTALDTPENLDLGSLQHHGDYALELVKQFGNTTSDDRRNNSVYFDVGGLMLVRYSSTTAILLLVVVGVLMGATLWLGVARQRITSPKLLVGLGVVVAALAASLVCASLVAWLTSLLGNEFRGIQGGFQYHSGLYTAAFAAFGLAGAAAVYVWAQRRTTWYGVVMSGVVVWFLLAVGTSIFLPAASYIFVWSLLSCLVGWLAVLSMNSTNRTFGKVLLVLTGFPAVLLFTSLLHKIATAFAASAYPIVTVVATLLFALLAWQLGPGTMPRRRLLPLLLSLIGGGLLVGALAVSGFNQSHPKQDNIFYVANADTGKQMWASFDDHPDAWTSQVLKSPLNREALKDFFPDENRRALQATSTALPLQAPGLTVLENQVTSDGRDVRIRVTSNREAPVISVLIHSDAPLVNALVDGKSIQLLRVAANDWVLKYYGVPRDGIDLAFQVKAPGPIKVKVEDTSYGLPQGPGVSLAARPAEFIASPAWSSDSTIVMRSFSL